MPTHEMSSVLLFYLLPRGKERHKAAIDRIGWLSIAVITRSAIACFPFSARRAPLGSGRVAVVKRRPGIVPGDGGVHGFFEMDAREPLKGSMVSLTRKIKTRTRLVKGWIMLYFGRATGNQQLESKGLASRPENNLKQRNGRTKGIFKR
ncbi:hypothetical protein [Nonomuraea sp. NPDC049695]|uniref:hypothetical protein n=1 Tax=Nonomuraea sp. NPDC049695 TaxID=3154734 RepID=UPI00343DD5C6